MDCRVELEPIIFSISHTTYKNKPQRPERLGMYYLRGEYDEPYDEDLEYVEEKKDIRFWLKVKFHPTEWEDSVEWNIPYIVVVRRFKDIGFRNVSDYNDKYKRYEDEGSFLFLMDRYINVPFFNIKPQTNIGVLINILLILSSTNNQRFIYSEQYYNIKPDLFFMEKDIENLNSYASLKYCIRMYNNIADNGYEWERNINGEAMSPNINIKNQVSKDERILSYEDQKTKKMINSCSFNVVPFEYKYTYAKSFDHIRRIKSTNSFGEDYRFAISGTYEECSKILQDEKKFDVLKKKVFKDKQDSHRRKLSNDSFDYFHRGGAESDYFDTMTDGQLGTYDDFKGDIDDIDTWSRG